MWEKGSVSTIFIQGARRIQSCWWRERIQSQGGSRQGKRKSDFKGQGKGHRERERSQEGSTSDQGSSGHRDGHFYGGEIDLKITSQKQE